MSHAGYHVRLVGDPRQTLAAAKESHADAVVVDLHDNERHVGWLLDVLATDAATAALPALVLADADVLDADRRRTLDARGVRVVPPTFSSDELLAAVAETLNARRPR
jgi:CheY-like chemotaxis protein